MKHKKSLILALCLVAVASFAIAAVALAGSSTQAVEWGKSPSGIRYSLTSLGMGWLVSGDRCDSNDYVMRINLNASYDPDRFRIFSYDSTVQKGFTDKSPMGHYLPSPSSHLCLGYRDTWNGGGPLHVARNMFVWIK